jgi:Spy/CpxP family protein refolding chaperone
MNTSNESPRNENNPAETPKRQRGGRWILTGVTAAVIGALSFAGLSHADGTAGVEGGHHGMMGWHGGQMDPEKVAKRIDHMIDRLLPDGTAAQKAQVATIIKTAMADLKPLREQRRAARQQGIKILSQPTIDRAALEQVRVSEVQLADQVSKRMTQALADTAEVLTPEQRARVAAHLKKRFGRMG